MDNNGNIGPISHRKALGMEQSAVFNRIFHDLGEFPGAYNLAKRGSKIVYEFLRGHDGSWAPVCEDDFDRRIKPVIKATVAASSLTEGEARWVFKQFFDGAIWDDEEDEEGDDE